MVKSKNVSIFLEELQMWLFSKGADREYCSRDRLGNFVQDIRTKLWG